MVAAALVGTLIGLPASSALAEAPTHRQVFRLWSPNIGDHMPSTNQYEAGNLGYRAESGYLFYAYPYGSANGATPAPTRPIYRCYIWGWEHMASTASNCEIGYGNEGVLGYLLTSPRAGHAALYRCKQRNSGDHFMSTSSSCEGHITEYVLGYYRVGEVATDVRLNEGKVDNECLGRCGLGCGWMPWEAWTSECRRHDECVRDRGHLACLPQLAPAAISYVVAGAKTLLRSIGNAVKSFFKSIF